MLTTWIVALAVVAGRSEVGAGSSDELATPERATRIVGGTPTASDAQVVALLDDEGAPFCTGALVTRDAVLTAAHCVVGPKFPDRIFIGEDVRQSGTKIPVSWIEVHPYFDPDTLQGDVALVRLEHDADVEPLELLTTSLSAGWVGDEVRLVGFGRPQFEIAEGLGIKRQTVQTILGVEDDSFIYGESTCHGDSGGPVLVENDGVVAIAGVVSSGAPGCRYYARARRVDVYRPWLDERIHAEDPPEAFLLGCAIAGPMSPVLAPWLLVLCGLGGLRRRRTTR